MESLEKAIQIINEHITIVNAQLKALQDVKLTLESQLLKGISSSLYNSMIAGSNSYNPNFNSSLYKGYPLEAKLSEKMKFLDSIHPHAWRLIERRELIIQIEGKERAEITLSGITGKLQNLRNSGQWIVAKYGKVNKYSFYLKPEWRTEDGEGIKPEFAIPPDILNKIPEEKRNKIDWLIK